MNSKIMGIVAIVITAVTLVMVIISLAIPYWLFNEATGIKLYIGLWRTCVEVSGTKACTATEPTGADKDKTNAVKAFMIIALVVILVALVVGVLVTFVMKKPILAFVAMGCDIFGMVCLLIAVCVYTEMAYNSDSEDYFHASFGLAIVAMVMALVGGILFLFAKPSNSANAIS